MSAKRVQDTTTSKRALTTYTNLYKFCFGDVALCASITYPDLILGHPAWIIRSTLYSCDLSLSYDTIRQRASAPDSRDGSILPTSSRNLDNQTL
jgi:hypothetical protein